MIAKILSWYGDFIEEVQQWFTAEAYQRKYGISDRFPSLFSVAFRFALKYLYIVVPAVWVLALVMGFGEDIPVIGAIIVSPIAAVIYCVLILIGFLVLMLLEACCKILASLILFNELPKGAENPADALLMSLVTQKS